MFRSYSLMKVSNRQWKSLYVNYDIKAEKKRKLKLKICNAVCYYKYVGIFTRKGDCLYVC